MVSDNRLRNIALLIAQCKMKSVKHSSKLQLSDFYILRENGLFNNIEDLYKMSNLKYFHSSERIY